MKRYAANSLFFLSVLIFLSCYSSLFARCSGKVDLGPAYIHLDVLESNKTIKTMDLLGVKADAMILFFEGKGWGIKPSLLYGRGDSRLGEVFSGGVGFGHCTPITDCFTVTPSVGITYGYIKTRIRIPDFFGRMHFTEKFRSTSPYLALDATYTIIKGLRVCGMFQYAWSRTHTTIVGVLKDKSNAKGPNYALMVEYDLNDHWSLQLAGAYNISLSKEKHGIRGAGGKLGVAYWF